MILGPVTFLNPLALWGLLALPIIWLVLKITPPKPIIQIFPPLRLLQDIEKKEDTPNKTPWWLLLYRLFMGAVLAIALASPVLFKPDNMSKQPIILLIDNGWAAAGNWSKMTKEAEIIIKSAISDKRDIALLTSADNGADNGADDNKNADFKPADIVLQDLKQIQPKSWDLNRKNIFEQIKKLDYAQADLIWLSDGVKYAQQDLPQIKSASNTMYIPASEIQAVFAIGAKETANGFVSQWRRVDNKTQRKISLSAYDGKGAVLAKADAVFEAGKYHTEARFELPAELRNRVSRIEANEFVSAGAVWLLDDNWGRPLVGLLKGSDENTQPLLSEWHYIEKALRPKADIYKGDLDELLAVSPSIIFMTDRARILSKDLEEYVKQGGMLVRFAGPKLAKNPDRLLPVNLRPGGRELGGALAWETPQGLAEFSKESPFFGLSVREDIVIKKQVLAVPGAKTDTNTWARLKDGSPVISSAKMGSGRIVLFHITAGPDWSSLPISGLYVQMLERILPLARTTKRQSDAKVRSDWIAEKTMDGFGNLQTADISVKPIKHDDFVKTEASKNHPPGIYKQGLRRQALNTISKPDKYKLLKPKTFETKNYGSRAPKSLAGILLGLFGAMLAFDVIMSLLASGRLRLHSARLASFIIFAIILAPNNVFAKNAFAKNAFAKNDGDALSLHLAYVITGNAEIDRMSRLGMEGLAFELERRTTIEPKGVRGVNLETDELAFYPFLYWPVTRQSEALSDKIADKINKFMANGGTIVLDTMDQERRRLFAGETHPGLARLSKNLDIPPLREPLTRPAEKSHVITKSFYLISDFPGRWADGKIWVEAPGNSSARDGVSTIIVGSNDWASAWAKDEKGRTISVIENEIPRQREMAIRFGINLVMYTLSGNYKADQVHTAKIIERLGEDLPQIQKGDE